MPRSATATTAPTPTAIKSLGLGEQRRPGRKPATFATVPKDATYTPTEQRDYEEAKAWFDGMVLHAKSFDHPIAVPQPKRVTPGLARVLLEHNAGNRNVSEGKVEDYKQDLVQDRWSINGESIKVAKDGSTNDGQHRCKAIIETGRSALMFFVFGLERDSRMTLDQGVSRTAAGNLQMSGLDDASAITPVASFVLMARETGRLSRGSRGRPTRAAVMDFVKHYEPQLRSAVSFIHDTMGRKSSVKTIATPPLLAFTYFMLRDKAGTERASAFMRELLTGVKEDGQGLSPGDAVFTLRERLLDLSRQHAHSGDKAHLIFRAWNQWVRGNKVRHIRLNRRDLLPVIETP